MKTRAPVRLAETLRRGRDLLVRAAAFVSARAIPWPKVLLAAGMIVLFSALGVLARRDASVARAEIAPVDAGTSPVTTVVLTAAPPQVSNVTAREVVPSIVRADPRGESAPALSPRARASADDPVILNTATLDDLERIPGVGPKKAQSILALRQKMGRFRQVEDLLRVKGIGRNTLKKIRPVVRVDPAPTFLDAGRGPS